MVSSVQCGGLAVASPPNRSIRLIILRTGQAVTPFSVLWLEALPSNRIASSAAYFPLPTLSQSDLKSLVLKP